VRLAVDVAVALVVIGVVLAFVLRHTGHDAQSRPAAATTPSNDSQSQLVAANYKVLTPSRTRRLLTYADAAYGCLSKVIHVTEPRAERTKIVMTLPASSSPAAALQAILMCSAKIGDPPTDSSFQVRGHKVLLYLPKYCILDKKVAGSTR
jgi:hypothetical protein